MDKSILLEKSFAAPLIGQCPICGSTLLSSHSHPLYRSCRECLAIFQVSDIHEVLDYFSDRKVDYSHQRGSYRHYIRLMSRFINFDATQSLVDVGAGDGTFLQACESLIHLNNLFAIEISPIAKETLLEKGFDVISTDQLARINKKVVTAFQVLEHIRYPRSFIESLHLYAGDYLVLTSPAVDSIWYKLYGQRWWGLSPSHHVILYSKKSLEILCGEMGFNLLCWGLCVSGSHGLFHSYLRYVFSLIKWPLKSVLGREAWLAVRELLGCYRIQPRDFNPSFPLFNGKNSFLAILKKS